MSKISVRLLIDREKKRVVFAEAGSDFIDVLFSFLTLPLGSIVRLLGKQTGLGSLDNIYESVEQLDTEDKVLYAEVGGDFTNQLLSFLTFPLGFVFTLLDDHMSMMGGCINNLYSSAEGLGLEWFKSENCKNIIVFPELPSYYGCKNQMLRLDEMALSNWTCSKSCIKCHRNNKTKSSPCKHGLSKAELIEQNPKLENGGSDFGGGFVEDSERFMIADDLHISPISVISAIKGIEFPISDIVEKEVNVSTAEVKSLLSAMLISKTVLTDVFFPKKKQQRKSQW